MYKEQLKCASHTTKHCKCNITAGGFFLILSFFVLYILLVRLRTFRLSASVSEVHPLSAGVHARAERM